MTSSRPSSCSAIARHVPSRPDDGEETPLDLEQLAPALDELPSRHGEQRLELLLELLEHLLRQTMDPQQRQRSCPVLKLRREGALLHVECRCR
jgi:CRISPR/Cas system CSM-associated protein Csm2 small subunit